VLVGYLGSEELPQVTGAIPALEADGQRASVTFTHDAWASIHKQLDRDFPGQQIVGWYHSHPGFGIFLSKYDRFIHDNFFSDAHQIAYVVDPHAGTEGVFWWRDGKLVLLAEGPAGRAGTGGNRSRSPSGRGRESLALTGGKLSYATAAVALVGLILLAVVLLSASSAPKAGREVRHRSAGILSGRPLGRRSRLESAGAATATVTVSAGVTPTPPTVISTISTTAASTGTPTGASTGTLSPSPSGGAAPGAAGPPLSTSGLHK
jgi:proteasome lid subunit RPN8/RPN11